MKFRKLILVAGLLALAGAVSATTVQDPLTPQDRTAFRSLFREGHFGVPRYAADPITCAAATKGIEYYNTGSNTVKFCNGTVWGLTGTGSTPALDNLASVSINTSLLAQTGVDLGSTTKPFRNLYLFGTGTYATTYGKFTAAPTSTRTYTFPDSDTTIPIAAQPITFSGPSTARTYTFPDAADTVDTLGAAQTITGVKTFSAAPIATTGIDLGSTAAQFRNLYLFGAGTFGSTYFKITGTPTGTRTVTVPDATDTIAELGQNQTFTGNNTFSGNNSFTGASQGNMTVKALTEASATAFVVVTVPSGSSAAGVVEYAVEANDASDFQNRSGSLEFRAVNKAGTTTITCSRPGGSLTIDNTTDAAAVSSGTLTHTFTCVDGGTGALQIKDNATSSLTQTTLQIRYRVRALAGTTLTIAAQ
jgi:hypothetical protein